MREQRGDGPLSVFFLTHFIFKVTPTFFICELVFFSKLPGHFYLWPRIFFNVSQIFQKIHKDKSRSYFEWKKTGSQKSEKYLLFRDSCHLYKLPSALLTNDTLTASLTHKLTLRMPCHQDLLHMHLMVDLTLEHLSFHEPYELDRTFLEYHK